MAYGDRYILLSSDVFERKFKVQIQEKDYTGITENLTAAGNSPVTIGFEGKGGTNVNKYDQIKATHCTISVYSTVDYQFLNLFTSDANKYKVIVSIDENGTYIPIFIGFIEPDIYEEPYVMVPYEVTIRAVDGLVRLKTIEFKDTGLNDVEQQLYIILWCLNQTELGLNLETFGQIYETAMTDPEDDSVFYYAMNNLMAFDGITAYEVLTEILTVYGCFLIQYRGQWVIGRIDERFENVPLTFKYLANGNANGYGSMNIVKSFTPARATKEQLLRPMYSNTVLMVIPAWKSFIINQDYNRVGSVIKNYNFKKYTTVVDPFVGSIKVPTSWSTSDADFFFIMEATPMAITYPFDWKFFEPWFDRNIVIFGSNTPSTIVSSVVDIESSGCIFKVNIYASPIYAPYSMIARIYIQISNGVDTYYLYKYGDAYHWALSVEYIDINFDIYYEQKYNFSSILDAETKSCPINGELKVTIQAQDEDVPGSCTLMVQSVNIDILNQYPNKKEIETLVSNNNYIPSDINVKIGDIPDFPDTEKVYYGGILLSDGTATKEWTDSYSSFSGELLLCLAYNMGRQYKTPSLMLQGTFKGVMDFMTTMVDESNLFRKFVWSHQVEYNVKQAEINGYMVELLPPPGTRVLGDESGNAIEFETDLLIEV